MIDLVLAGDNAVVIGLAVNRLTVEQRKRAILVGILGATMIRIIFALFALHLLAIIGLTLAGGILLLWVVWKSARELREGSGGASGAAPATLKGAIWRIIIADISMSLDNVLAVAGAAREHPAVLVMGLAVSVILMGVAASFIARLLSRLPWLAWLGLGIVLYVSLAMIYEGMKTILQQVH